MTLAEPTSADAVAVESDEPAHDAPVVTPRWWRRAALPARRRIVPVMLAVLVAASLALLGTLVIRVSLPEREVDSNASHSVLTAASTAAVALLSYAPETIQQDLDAAKAGLTGDFLKYYTEFTGQFVEPSALQKGVKNTATVVRAAVSEMQRDSAKVLLFINQTTTTRDKPQPTSAASSVLVTMTKVDGKWLVSAFDPNAA